MTVRRMDNVGIVVSPGMGPVRLLQEEWHRAASVRGAAA